MSLIKWTGGDIFEPFHDLAQMQEDMNRLFARGWLAKTPALPGNGSKWLPEVDITEDQDTIHVKADIPGMKLEDISVEVENDILTIKGERKQESEKKEGQVRRVERSWGEFLRSFSLPSNVDASKVNASYKNGVLEVTLPKKESAKPKQIKVDVK